MIDVKTQMLHVRASTIAVLAGALSCGGEAPIASAPTSTASVAAPTVAAAPSTIAERLIGVEREAARAAPGQMRPAVDFAAAVDRILGEPNPLLGADAAALVAEALGYVDGALASPRSVEEKVVLGTKRAALLARAGRGGEAIAILAELMDRSPNIYTLHTALDVHRAIGEPIDHAALCKRVRPTVKQPAEILTLLEMCMAASRAAKPEIGLAWASEADIARYRKMVAERAVQDERANERIDEELMDQANDAGAPPRR